MALPIDERFSVIVHNDPKPPNGEKPPEDEPILGFNPLDSDIESDVRWIEEYHSSAERFLLHSPGSPSCNWVKEGEELSFPPQVVCESSFNNYNAKATYAFIGDFPDAFDPDSAKTGDTDLISYELSKHNVLPDGSTIERGLSLIDIGELIDPVELGDEWLYNVYSNYNLNDPNSTEKGNQTINIVENDSFIFSREFLTSAEYGD